MSGVDRAVPDSPLLALGRQAGAIMHISCLPGAHGIGDIVESSRAFVDQLSDMGLAMWQFLPLGPTAYGDSPYQPLSAFAGNANLIGLAPLVELGLLDSSDLAPLEALPRDYTDFGALIPVKRALLLKAAGRLNQRRGNGLSTDYEAFLHEHADRWLDDYALFRVLKTAHGERPWPEWGAEYVRRDAAALARVREEQREAIECTRITQFLFDRQWRELRQYAESRGVRLLGDIPIYIALDSSDAWAHPELLLIGEGGQPSHVAGVPPDYFSEDGQLWGNPLYDWDYHERSGYEWWIDRMRHIGRQTDFVRIDHFRGFESFWSVPASEETARNGEWLPGPGDSLFEAMRTAFGKLPIVAEDLGVITPEVEALRDGQGFPGMVVLQFEVGDPEFDFDSIDPNSVIYTGTHDNDTTTGWFHGNGDDTRTEEEILTTRTRTLELTNGGRDTIHEDMIRLAFSSRSTLAMVPMQDFLGLGSEARLNIPGTTLNNWRWRMREEQWSPARSERVAGMAANGGRLPGHAGDRQA